MNRVRKFSLVDSTLRKASHPIIAAICTSEPVSCILIKGDYTIVALKERSFQAQTISWELPASLQHKQWAGLKLQSGNARFVVNSRKPDRGERVKVHCCFEKRGGGSWSWFQWQWMWPTMNLVRAGGVYSPIYFKNIHQHMKWSIYCRKWTLVDGQAAEMQWQLG